MHSPACRIACTCVTASSTRSPACAATAATPSACSTSTSIASRWSTTASAMAPATRCWPRSQAVWPPACANPTRWRAWPATSSCSCSSTWRSRKPRARWRSACWKRWRHRCRSPGASCGCRRASVSRWPTAPANPPTASSTTPTRRCTAPRAWAATASSSSTMPCTRPRWACSTWSRRCAGHWPATSSCRTSNRWCGSTTNASSATRPCCAGGIRSAEYWPQFRLALEAGRELVRDGSFITLNVSPRLFQYNDFDRRLLAMTREVGFDPRRLRLEVTEGTLLSDPMAVAATLQRLRETGIEAALDDFGTGYSSLGHLHQFPLKMIKIDRSFITPFAAGVAPRSSAVIEAILALGNALGAEIVAEGIETEYQCEVLKAMGCVYGQGFLFARPAPASHWLAEAAVPA